MSYSISVKVREKAQRSRLKQLRREGRIPAVVFGANESNINVDVPRKEFIQWMRTGGGSVVQLKLDKGDEVPVLLEDIQRDALTQEIIHVDFLRVNPNKEVRTKLPLVYIGTPVGTKQGAVVQTNATDVEVQALPAQIPDSLNVDISHLEAGQSLEASELELPEGVSLVSSAAEILVTVVGK